MALQGHLAAGVAGAVLGTPSSPSHAAIAGSPAEPHSSTCSWVVTGRTILPPFPQPEQNCVTFWTAFMAEMVLNNSWSGNLSSYCLILKENKTKMKRPFPLLFVILLITVLQHFPRPIMYCLGRLAECQTYSGVLYSGGSWKKSSRIQTLIVSSVYPNADSIYTNIYIHIIATAQHSASLKTEFLPHERMNK